jgi:hypothetical protein
MCKASGNAKEVSFSQVLESADLGWLDITVRTAPRFLLQVADLSLAGQSVD